MNIGHSSSNEVAILQQQGNIGITEKKVLNLELNKNNVNIIKLATKGSKKVGDPGNQEQIDTDISN